MVHMNMRKTDLCKKNRLHQVSTHTKFTHFFRNYKVTEKGKKERKKGGKGGTYTPH